MKLDRALEYCLALREGPAGCALNSMLLLNGFGSLEEGLRVSLSGLSVGGVGG